MIASLSNSFLGLGLIDKAPDHRSLTNFKNRVLEYVERMEQDLLKEIFDDVVILAQEKGIHSLSAVCC
jgi:hypothetical protein